jgi:hypothetical protein
VLTETITSTIEVTNAYTITSTYEPPTTEATVVVPITLGTSIPVTEVVTVPSEETETTTGGVVYTSIIVPVSSTYTAPPGTTTVPASTATISSTKTPSSSAPLEVSTGAAPTNKPMAYALAGAMALFALA